MCVFRMRKEDKFCTKKKKKKRQSPQETNGLILRLKLSIFCSMGSQGPGDKIPQPNHVCLLSFIS